MCGSLRGGVVYPPRGCKYIKKKPKSQIIRYYLEKLGIIWKKGGEMYRNFRCSRDWQCYLEFWEGLEGMVKNGVVSNPGGGGDVINASEARAAR